MRQLAWMLFVGGLLLPAPAFAQAKAYGTSGMDRGQAGIARLQVQQVASAKAIEAIAQCGNQGRLYGPGFSGAKSGNCPNNLTVRSGGGIAVNGGATIAGATALSGTLAVSGTSTFGNKVTVSAGGLDVKGNTTLRNNLAVSGTATVGGAVTITGTTTANGQIIANKGLYVHNGWARVYGNYGLYFQDHGGGWYMSDATWIRAYNNKSIYTPANIRADGQFQIGSSVFGPPPVCNVNTQKLYWNNGWSCKTTIGSAGAGETDPQVGGLTSGKWCYSNGSQVICNQPAPTANAFRKPPACNATTHKLRWTGSTWECVADNAWSQISGKPAYTIRWPKWSEVSSKPAYATRWPKWSEVSGKPAVITSETDPQVGSISSGKWCMGSGGKVVCNQNPPSAGSNCGSHKNGQITDVIATSHTVCDQSYSEHGVTTCIRSHSEASVSIKQCVDGSIRTIN